MVNIVIIILFMMASCELGITSCNSQKYSPTNNRGCIVSVYTILHGNKTFIVHFSIPYRWKNWYGI